MTKQKKTDISIEVYYQEDLNENHIDNYDYLFHLNRRVPIQLKPFHTNTYELESYYYFDINFCKDILNGIFSDKDNTVTQQLLNNKTVYLYCRMLNDYSTRPGSKVMCNRSYVLRVTPLNLPVRNHYEFSVAKVLTKLKNAGAGVNVFNPETSLIVEYEMNNINKKELLKKLKSRTGIISDMSCDKYIEVEENNDELHKFESGMVRSKDADKADFTLIPRAGLEFMGRTMKMGAAKYGPNNWQKGTKEVEGNDALNHALQHIYKWLDGDRTENHLAHCACNLFFAMHYNREELENLNP